MSAFKRDESLGLGNQARDRITGFAGTVVAITEWLNGCRRITIQPNALHDGKPIDSYTFDAEQMEKLEEGPQINPMRTGGPSMAPQRPRDPR